MAENSLYYCSMPLQRNSALRQDNDWLDTQFASDAGLIVTTWSQMNLVRFGENGPEPVYLKISDAALILGNSTDITYLGHDSDAPVFAVDLGNLQPDKITTIINHAAAGCELVNLRKIGTLLTPEQASILAYARGMAFWHQQNAYCSRCGSPNRSARGGHMLVCNSCERQNFPRIEPAVIMLVEQSNPEDGINRCLLGRHAGLPGQMYSTLAGFVDPLENLEQAVVREVYEESGLRVNNLVYMGSQPWPFPASIMLGFRAKTNDKEIHFDPEELEHAAWFTAAEVRKFSEADISQDNISLPPEDSIARYLIDQWLEENP